MIISNRLSSTTLINAVDCLHASTSIQGKCLKKWSALRNSASTEEKRWIATAIGDWTWSPSPAFQIENATGGAEDRLITRLSPLNIGPWSPFSSTLRKKFNNFIGAKSLMTQTAMQNEDAHITRESWRPSQSEDTYDLDANIIKLLSLDGDRLPKPCDPLTYCFWKHGMRRRFESITRNSPYKANASQFTVCSYNVLCQRTLCNYVQKLYSHCPFEHLTWPRRWALLSVELQMLDADVFCLQEVQHDHFDKDYMPFFSRLGYDGTFKRKLRGKSDGCATFWRRDKFRPILVYPVEYSLPSPHEHSDSVALITVFEPTSNQDQKSLSDRLIIANTHLIYQPACGATKLCQAALLLAHLQKVSRTYGAPNQNAPLVLCGDFNSTPHSPLYSLLVDGQLRYEGLNGWSISGQQQQQQNQDPESIRLVRLVFDSVGDEVLGQSLLPRGSPCTQSCTLSENGREENGIEGGRLEHQMQLKSVYDHVTDRGEREVTTFLRDQPIAVDYIFYSTGDKIRDQSTDKGKLESDVNENGLRCLERYRLPGPSQMNRNIGYLPNQYCASDHLPLMAKFALA